ncbi:MAG: phosphoglycerate kinase [Gammaproteobacteria bacterium]|nr:phosphoglycerate kinase [Gammaproteobacteria bacterium]
MNIIKMQDVELKNKRVVIREDFNVPLKEGKITSNARIVAALPTIKMALKAKAAVILLSHLGRPTAGHIDENFSLEPVALRLSELLGQEVKLITNWLDGIDIKPGEVVLCENTRFHDGEKQNNDALAKAFASLGDVYVMDAFATAHRAEASTCGVAKFAPIACAGPLLVAELAALEKALNNPKAPIVAIVGGSKVSTKLKVLDSLLKKVDTLIVGGGIANTFIAAEGHSVGGSLCEPDFLDEAARLLEEAQTENKLIPIPTDVVVAEHCAEDIPAYTQPVTDISEDEKILDIGPETAKMLADKIAAAQTIFWNGPVGTFEVSAFSKGTETIAKAIANSKAFSIAGGGDTLAAIDKYGIAKKISYISTGGGAFLAYLEGSELPAIKALEEHAAKNSKSKKE